MAPLEIIIHLIESLETFFTNCGNFGDFCAMNGATGENYKTRIITGDIFLNFIAPVVILYSPHDNNGYILYTSWYW
jgi:hypothetical protein